jgi:REP element-mobilizing transposase RayT
VPRARNTLVSLDATPYYHCVSRCVRGAFLCGKDKSTGDSYEHRRGWIEERMLELAKVFAVDVCAYAVMSNHYHVVLHVDKEMADSWSDREVVQRWHTLFKGHMLSQRFICGAEQSKAERLVLQESIDEWRKRLSGISWFMRCINEPIAREANKEDNATGRFWEGRFTSQALLDEKALMACLAYVDLNPIRAKMAKTPEKSQHTSVQQRIRQAQRSQVPGKISQQPETLMPFAGYPRNNMPKGLPFRLQDYLELIDWTGRVI